MVLSPSGPLGFHCSSGRTLSFPREGPRCDLLPHLHAEKGGACLQTGPPPRQAHLPALETVPQGFLAPRCHLTDPVRRVSDSPPVGKV